LSCDQIGESLMSLPVPNVSGVSVPRSTSNVQILNVPF